MRRNFRALVNEREVVVWADPIHIAIPRESIARVDYTDDLPVNGIPGTWPGPDTVWAVPSLLDLAAAESAPPATGQYSAGEWPAARVVLSLREPNRLIALIAPDCQPSVTTRVHDRPGDQEQLLPLAPEEIAQALCLCYFRQAPQSLQRLVDQRGGVPPAQVPFGDFSTSPRWHSFREVNDYSRLILVAGTCQQLTPPTCSGALTVY